MRMEWELVLFFGAPLVWGAWQLWTLRRDRRAAQRDSSDSSHNSADHDAR